LLFDCRRKLRSGGCQISKPILRRHHEKVELNHFLSRMYFSTVNKQGGSVDDVTDQAKGLEFIEQYKMRKSNNTKYAIAEKRYNHLMDNGFGHAHFVLFSGGNFGKTCVYLAVVRNRGTLYR